MASTWVSVCSPLPSTSKQPTRASRQQPAPGVDLGVLNFPLGTAPSLPGFICPFSYPRRRWLIRDWAHMDLRICLCVAGQPLRRWQTHIRTECLSCGPAAATCTICGHRNSDPLPLVAKMPAGAKTVRGSSRVAPAANFFLVVIQAVASTSDRPPIRVFNHISDLQYRRQGHRTA